MPRSPRIAGPDGKPLASERSLPGADDRGAVLRGPRTTLSMEQASGGPGRRLRLQADARLAKILRPPTGPGDSGSLELPTREAVSVGDVIHVEISFGALADEITLDGFVTGSTPRGERAPLVTIRFRSEHESRVRYVHEVLTKVRVASARSSRRLNSQVQATWFWGLGVQPTTLSDISRGGAFIRSAAPPSVGNTINLEINDGMVPGVPAGPMRLQATVAWVGRSQGHRGFGVKFRVASREVASRIATLVRWHEQGSAGEL